MLHHLRHSGRTVARRWRRNLLTVCAMAAGTAAAVAMLGISQGSADLVVQRLQAYEATAITATLPVDSWVMSESELLHRTDQIEGLRSAGTLVVPQSGSATLELRGAVSREVAQTAITVATSEGLASRGVSFVAGSFPADSVIMKEPTLVVVGSALARELGVSTEPGANRLILLGRIATVVGIIKDGAGSSSLTTALVMSPESARYFGQLPTSRQLTVEVEPGAAESVAETLPIVLYPQSPKAVTLLVPPSPELLRTQLTSSATGLVLVVTAVTLGTTLFGIITTMQISVWERRREIGLSRALGMTKGGIALSFLWESIILGGAGSALGWIVGVLISATVAALSGWDQSLPPQALAIPIFGLAVGALAGVIPARSASSVDPAELLRS